MPTHRYQQFLAFRPNARAVKPMQAVRLGRRDRLDRDPRRVIP
jgi:hypothetical protein